MIEVASVAVRFALYVDLMLLFGLPLFGLYALRGTERVSGSVLPFRRLIWPLALIGVALSSVALILLAAAMSGVGPGAVDREAIGMVVTGASALRGTGSLGFLPKKLFILSFMGASGNGAKACLCRA